MCGVGREGKSIRGCKNKNRLTVGEVGRDTRVKGKRSETEESLTGKRT